MYKIVKSKDIEKTLNEMEKDKWKFIGFVPMLNSGLLSFGVELLFKK